MTKGDYYFWLAYHYGGVGRPLTKNELKEVRASDFAMELLVPTDVVLKKCGGLDNLKKLDIYHDSSLTRRLAQEFEVPEEVVRCKLYSLIYDKEKENETRKPDAMKKIKKVNGNVISVNFKKSL